MSKMATVRQEETYKAISGLASEVNKLSKNITEMQPQSVCPLYDTYMERIAVLSKAMYVLADDAKRYAD